MQPVEKEWGSEKIEKTLFLITAFIILLIAIYAVKMSLQQEAGWLKFAVVDQFATLLLLGVCYKARKYLNLKMYTLVLGCLFLVLHNIGTLGPYDWTMVGLLRYDKMLHLFAGFLLFFLFYEFFMHSFEHGKHTHIARTLVLAMLCAMGIGACTEIIEYVMGYLYNNPGAGFFFYGIGDFGEWHDTIFDMIANFLGNLAGIIALLISRWKK